MPPAEPAPDLSSRLLARAPRRSETGNEYQKWKSVADELKLAGYPMNLGASIGVGQFSPELRKKARHLDQQIESLITPLKEPNRVEEAIMTLRIAICQGLSKEEFQKLMSEHNFSLKCNVIWESDAIAYRCNTCSLTPCMSLCATCFKGGNHEGHDVTRFFSREGGACDCGNDDVLRDTGFCSNHGENAERPPPPPVTIVSLAELILLRLLMVVLDHFRTQKRDNPEQIVPAYMLIKDGERIDQVCGAGKLIALLQECVDFGGPIRDAFTRILIDRKIYKGIWAVAKEDVQDKYSVQSFRTFREKHRYFEQMSELALKNEMMAEFFPDFPADKMKNKCFLHELLFWMRIHVFPQSLINLTLVFLGDTEYRDQFALRFFLLYPWTADSIRDACMFPGMEYRNISAASSRIIHVSVQMLSSAALCFRLTKEINLPMLMFNSVGFLLLKGDQKAVPIRPLPKEIQPLDHAEELRSLQMRYEVIRARRNAQREEERLRRIEEDRRRVEERREERRRIRREEREREEREETQAVFGLVREGEEEVEVAEEAMELVEEEEDSDEEFRGMGGRVEIIRFNEDEDADEEGEEGDDEDEERDRVRDRVIPRRMETLHFPRLTEEQINERRRLEEIGEWFTLDVASQVLHLHGYWFAMGDTQNLLSHSDVVSMMCRDEKTMTMYFRVIEKMQCMDSITRISAGDHLLNERADIYQRTLVLEYEMSASSMFNMAFGLVANRDDKGAAAFFDACWKSLKNWFNKMDLDHAGRPFQLGKSTVTFHLPLSRHLATIVHYTFDQPSIIERLEHFANNESKDLLHMLMLHPLRIQAARAEWAAGMWVRNGQQMRIPACLYSQTHMLFSYFVPDLDLMRLCAANLDPADVLHAIFEAFSLGDVLRWKRETGTSGVCYSPNTAISLKRPEWVDTLVFGCFRLIAELVLLPGVGEQTAEESMKDDIVCKLAIAEMPHSRLRTSMAEKGSHGAELVDSFFEKILAEVALFSDPEVDDTLDQGVYTLSVRAQLQYLDPILVMGRSTSLRHAASALQRLEQSERRISTRPEHLVKNVWTPYRLPYYPQLIKRRSKFNAGVFRLLVNHRLFETFCYLIEWYIHDSSELEKRLSGVGSNENAHEFLFKEQTMQLMIYLMTAAFLYMKTQPNEEELRKVLHIDLSDPDGPPRSLANSLLNIGPVLMALNLKRGEISKQEEERRVRLLMRGAVRMEVKPRIVAGTPPEYYGRLLATLYKDDEHFHAMLDERFPAVVEEKMEVEEQKKPAAENTPNNLIAKKKAAAAALRAKITASQNNKGGALMKKLMVEEKMTQEDLDRLDVSDKTVEQYECPICSDETPASFDQAIGLLVYVQFNGSYLNSIDASTPEKSLIELDEELQKDPEAAKRRCQNHALFWREQNSAVEPMIAGEHCDLIATPSMMELKTCGHHAHISCLEQYRETIYNQQRERIGQLHEIVFCPKCRFVTNGLLPLRVGTGMEENVGEKLRSGQSEARLAVFDTLMKQLKLTLKNIEGVDEHEAESSVGAKSSIYSLATVKHLVEHNLSTRGSDAEKFLEENTHIFLQGLLMRNIERNLYFDGLGVSPVRPKCIDLVSEHLNFHSALSLKTQEVEFTMAHVKELLIDEPTCPSDNKGIADPMEGTSGYAGHSAKTIIDSEMAECDLTCITDEDREILSPKKMTQDPLISLALQHGLTSPALDEKERANVFRLFKFSPAKLQFSNEWKIRCQGKPAIDHDNRFPILFSNPFALATRMTSIMMSSELTKESILESLRIFGRRLVALAAVRWTVLHCCKVDYERLREWAMEEEGDERDAKELIEGRPNCLSGVRRVVARIFCSNKHLVAITKSLEKREFPDFEENVIMQPMHDLLMRIAQLWHEVRLVALPEGLKSAMGMTRDQLETHVFGPDGVGVHPTYFVIAQWALNAVKPLVYIVNKKKMLVEEPNSFRPFLTLRLPESYDDIFARYFGRTCRRCCKVPPNPMICLICSEMICLDMCCHSQNANGENCLEPETHPCGVHIPFLALNSALIVLVKLRVEGLTTGCRAQIWGSVYLDAHGEEDRNLRRGKPLKLAQKRVERLYRDFLEGDVEARYNYHSISNLAEALRDAHYILLR